MSNPLHDMDKENLFNNNTFPSKLRYNFAVSPSSTDSESDDDVLTRQFSRSTSLQQPSYDHKVNRVFSVSPESTLGWPVSGHSPAPATMKTDEEAWNLIYLTNKHTRAPSSFPHRSWRSLDGEDIFRSPELRRTAGEPCGCGGYGGSRPPSFSHSPWPNQHKPGTVPVMKPAIAGGATAKRECAGTGVFIPRRYCEKPPESRKRQPCLPARMMEASNKNMDAIAAQGQAQGSINGGFVTHYELLMLRRNSMIQAAHQRRSGGAMEAAMNNPEMLLPQEWTY